MYACICMCTCVYIYIFIQHTYIYIYMHDVVINQILRMSYRSLAHLAQVGGDIDK